MANEIRTHTHTHISAPDHIEHSAEGAAGGARSAPPKETAPPAVAHLFRSHDKNYKLIITSAHLKAQQSLEWCRGGKGHTHTHAHTQADSQAVSQWAVLLPGGCSIACAVESTLERHPKAKHSIGIIAD